MVNFEEIKKELINEIENNGELVYYKEIDFNKLKNKLDPFEYQLFRKEYFEERYRAYLVVDGIVNKTLKKYQLNGNCACNNDIYKLTKEFLDGERDKAFKALMEIKKELGVN